MIFTCQTCYCRTSFQIHIIILNILQGSSRRCEWLFLWCLLPWINHLPPICWSTFWKFVSKYSKLISLTKWIMQFYCFSSSCLYIYISNDTWIRHPVPLGGHKSTKWPITMGIIKLMSCCSPALRLSYIVLIGIDMQQETNVDHHKKYSQMETSTATF